VHGDLSTTCNAGRESGLRLLSWRVAQRKRLQVRHGRRGQPLHHLRYMPSRSAITQTETWGTNSVRAEHVRPSSGSFRHQPQIHFFTASLVLAFCIVAAVVAQPAVGQNSDGSLRSRKPNRDEHAFAGLQGELRWDERPATTEKTQPPCTSRALRVLPRRCRIG